MLWLPTLLRDREQIRDWLRPWRDPPGLLPAMLPCCCDEECEVTVGCCADSIPCRLHAAITISGVCETSAELDICNQTTSPRFWRGLKTVSGYTWHVILECTFGGSLPVHFSGTVIAIGSGCNGAGLTSDLSSVLEPDCADAWEGGHSYPITNGSVAMTATSPTSSSCDPLSLFFTRTTNGPAIQSANGSCACGNGGALDDGESFTCTLTITEP